MVTWIGVLVLSSIDTKAATTTVAGPGVPNNGFIDEIECHSKGHVLMEYAQSQQTEQNDTLKLVTFGPTIGGSHCFGDLSIRAHFGAFGFAGADAFSALILGAEFGWNAGFGGSYFIPSQPGRSLSLFGDVQLERGKSFDPFYAAQNGITSADQVRSSTFMHTFTSTAGVGGVRGAFLLNGAHNVAIGIEAALEHSINRDSSTSDMGKVTGILSSQLGGLGIPSVTIAGALSTEFNFSRNQSTYLAGLGVYETGQSAFQYGFEFFKLFPSDSSFSVRGTLNFFY